MYWRAGLGATTTVPDIDVGFAQTNLSKDFVLQTLV